MMMRGIVPSNPMLRICLVGCFLRLVGGHGEHFTDNFNITHDTSSYCTTVIHKFDPQHHKSIYRVGVYTSEGEEEAFRLYGKVFVDYLSATAGKRINPPVSFELIPVTLTSLMDLAETEDVDFMFSSSAVFSCMATEYAAQPLVTIINRRESRGVEYDLDVYGGVMFVLKDNDEINSIEDFKGRVIGAGSITAMGGGQTQFYELVRHGLSYVADPKQVIFTGDERLVVQGLLDGDFEIGFARTDQIERHTNEDGSFLNDDTFKVINPQTHVLDDGTLFPFVSSTGLHPEWPVAVLSHVEPTIAQEVQEALLAIRDHALFIELKEKMRCDTTTPLAQLAVDATTAGLFTGFRLARSYFEVRTKQEAAGFIRKMGKGIATRDLRCIRGDTLYEDIECPDDHYKVTEEEFHMSCELAGLPCKEGYECFCQPCIKAFEVDVYQYNSNSDGDNNNNTAKHQGCEKMSLCAHVQQRHEIVMHAVDNRERDNVNVKVIVHVGDDDETLDVEQVAPHVYEFRWSHERVGVGIFEVFVDDVQIPESPLRMQVVVRDCEAEFGDKGMTAMDDGECACRDGTVSVGDDCVDVAVFAVLGSFLCLGMILIATLWFIRRKHHMNDQLWRVHADELHLDDPVEVIGQGSFGVVLLAEYRGTKVAIKRALKGRRKGSNRVSATDSRRISSNLDSTMGTRGTALSTRSVFQIDNASRTAMSSRSNFQIDASRSRSHDLSSGHVNDTDNHTHSSGSSHDQVGEHAVEAYQGAVDDSPRSRPSDFAVENSGFSLGFLKKEVNSTKSRWAMVFPWLTDENKYTLETVHDSIMGADSHNSFTTPFAQALCPWTNENLRRREEFKAEMRVLSRLRHPCITTVMGAVVAPHRDPVLVMEYMEYGSLHDLLRNETMVLSGDIILQIARDLAQGLRFLHSNRPPILHGDLKARNLLVDSRFRAKLCDFGMSTKRTNNISGTPYWLAPEYLMGIKQYNPACDVYSVGVILWEMYARKCPYEGEDFRDVIRAVCNRRVNKRPKIPLETPPKFSDLMKKCWSPDAHYRPEARNLDILLMEMSPEDAEPTTEDERASKNRAGDLLYDIFPTHVADALKEGKKIDPEKHEMVTVIFSDIVTFTDISRQIGPEKVCDMLDRLYVAFDACARKHNVFKVETIGDAWMGVTNLEGNQKTTHVKQIAEYAIDMVNAANMILIDPETPTRGYVNIRVGFHSGPVVSNVIGSLNKRYCLFGDTVNTASRMESNSQGNRILCSERSYTLLKDQAPTFFTKCRGKIEVKGKGTMLTWWIGDNRINARKGLKTKSVEFDFRASTMSTSFQDLSGLGCDDDDDNNNNNNNDDDDDDDDDTISKLSDKGSDEHANDNEFIQRLTNTIDSAEEDLKSGNEMFVQSDVVINYQEMFKQ